MKIYEVYTDGACKNNQAEGLQPGGWSAAFLDGRSFSGGSYATTNNRMEIQGAIEALKNTEVGSRVMLYSDSAYVINTFKQGWIDKWEKNGFITASKKKPVENQDLIKELRSLERERTVEFIKVKGHSGNKYNELADKLAVDAIPTDGKRVYTIELGEDEYKYLKELVKGQDDDIAKNILNRMG
jgi:ribonuclease HI